MLTLTISSTTNMEIGKQEENGKLARALYTNTPEARNELFFRKGDILTVIEFDYQGQTGWWHCSLFGERGICPGNYLELLEHDYVNQEVGGETEDSLIPSYDVPKSSKEGIPAVPNPLDLYDVPKNDNPIYQSASLVRIKKRNPGSDKDSHHLSPGRCSNRVSSISSTSSSGISSSSGYTGSRPDSPLYENECIRGSINSGNDSSIASPIPPEIVEPEYDVPRSTAIVRKTSPPTYMSASRGCISVVKSDSKDNLDLYDVPRSVKSCVSIFENKYDHVPPRLPSSCKRDGTKRASLCSVSSSGSSGSTGQSAIDVHLGVVLKNAETLRKIGDLCNSTSKKESFDESYDVPRSVSRTDSLQSWSDSTSSNLDQSGSYDFGTENSQRQSVSKNGSTETLSNEIEVSRRPISHVVSCRSFDGSCQTQSSPEVKILPLSAKAGVTICEKLRQEIITSINSILHFVKPKWRLKSNLADVMPEVRFGCVRLNLGVKDFSDFCSRTICNAKRNRLEPLVIRLQKLLGPVTNGSQILQKDLDELDAYMWSVDRLSIDPNEKEPMADALDQLILCARNIKHDVMEISNFIGLNSSALFQEETENQIPSSTMKVVAETTVEDIEDDYDYVTLSTSTTTVQSKSMSVISSRDQQILDFYSTQISTITPNLSTSISTFISSIHQNDPPKIFNGHLKYVILLAYKMLFAGDTIHRNLTSNETVKLEIEGKADELHKSIVALHEASRIAARDFPKLLPMQSVVDHVWETTTAATQLKKAIFNATLL